MQNTDNVIENIDDSVREIGTLAGIEPSGVTADPANTDFFIENIDENVKAIAETLDVTPSEVTADPANTDFFVENIAKNVDLIKDNFSGGGGDVTIESLTVTQNGTYEEEGKAYTPVVVNVPVPELTLTPPSIKIGGQSGAVEIKPQVAIDISTSLTSLANMFSSDSTITSIKFPSSINLNNVDNVYQMCQNCGGLKNIEIISNLSNNGVNCQQMFAGCRYLEEINIPLIKPNQATAMFNECFSLIEFPALDTSICYACNTMFAMGTFEYNKLPQVTHVYNLNSASSITNIFQRYGYYAHDYLTQQSVDNILQTLLTLTSYSGNKTWRTLFQYDPVLNDTYTGKMYDLIINSQYYQAVINAGWPSLT